MLRALIAVFVIFTVLYGQAVEAKPIVIGVATDTEILDGFATVRGLKLAVEEINAAGGVNIGGKKEPFKLEVMDTRDCDAGVPVSEALLVVEKVILDKGAVGTIFQWQDGKRVVIYPPKIAVSDIQFPPWMVDYWKIKK